MTKLITIGKILKNHGNKGEVKVLPLTDFPARFKNLTDIYLVDESDNQKPLQIEKCRFHKKFVIIKFKEINNISRALSLKDHFIDIPEEELVPLKNNEFYIHQLLNSKVYTEKGKYLGDLTDVISTGGTDIFVVGKDKIKNKYMIPASREIITSIDPKENIIRVNPVPGLLEL